MSQASALEQLMLDLINEERANAGLQPLRFNGDLNEASEDHSSWMLETDIFSHTGQNGSTAGDRIQQAGYELEGNWTYGENVAWQSERGDPGLEDDVRDLHESLMNSPSHRDNILNPDFEEIGIGIERGDFDSYDSVMVTQNFGTTDATPDPIIPSAPTPPTPMVENEPEPAPPPQPTPTPAPQAPQVVSQPPAEPQAPVVQPPVTQPTVPQPPVAQAPVGQTPTAPLDFPGFAFTGTPSPTGPSLFADLFNDGFEFSPLQQPLFQLFDNVGDLFQQSQPQFQPQPQPLAPTLPVHAVDVFGFTGFNFSNATFDFFGFGA